MKNKIVWISGIVVVVILGYCFWCQRSGLPVDTVLPTGAIFYARLNHVEKHINQVIQSDMGKNMAAIDLPEVLARNNFSRQDIRYFQVWQKDLRKMWDNPLMRKFLSQETAVGVYQKDNRYEILITLRLTASAKAAEFLGQFSHQWGEDIAVTRESYQGCVINHIVLKKKGFKFSYVRLRDLLIVSPEDLGRLEEVVDVYRHKHDSLSRDPQFMAVNNSAYPSGDALVFINMNRVSDLWRNKMDSRLEAYGYKEAAFADYGLSYLPGEVSRYKLIARIDEKHLSARMQKTLSCPALSNDSLKLVPSSAIAYNWGGCYDFGESWQTARQRLRRNPQWDGVIHKIRRGLERRLHINIERDLLPVLGHEVGGYLTDVDMQGKFPFPRMLIFVKIQNRPAAESLLERVTDNVIPNLKSEEYAHVKIRYMSLPSGANMDPGYAFIGDYLLVATTRQLLKVSIDAYNDSMRSIVSDDVVKQFSLDDGAKFHSVTLMKTAELSRRVQDFLGWIDKYLSSQVSLAAAAKQDGANKTLELTQAIADKEDELKLAESKLFQLRTKSLGKLSDDESLLITGAIGNLSREEETIRTDIVTYREQKSDLSGVLAKYARGAQADKLTMFNMDNVLLPLVKGLEAIDAQAVTVRFGSKILETEILVK
jgi:hypothetical protein